MTGQQLIDKVKAEGRNLLTEVEAKELLKPEVLFQKVEDEVIADAVEALHQQVRE